MKILLLSGAYKNAGDYLIVERCRKLLYHHIPNAEIEIMLENESFDGRMDYVNQFDWIVFGGGPGYIYEFYPKFVKLSDDLDQIKPKIIALGMGWYGTDDRNNTVYAYRFAQKNRKLYERILKDSRFLGCRDQYSVRALEHQGLHGATMTGCPAWYDLENVDRLDLRDGIDTDFKKIYVSDPANVYENSEQCLALLAFLKHQYPNSMIKFVFHRGTGADDFTGSFEGKQIQKLKESIQKMGIECLDISFGMEGFSVYDDADLHIGYRVHAHIYNLSKRNVTLLIEEDGRGAGVNEALGLPRLYAYFKRAKVTQNLFIKAWRKIAKNLSLHCTEKNNPYLIQEVEDVLYLLRDQDFRQYHWVFEKMNAYYQKMVQAIESMKTIG